MDAMERRRVMSNIQPREDVMASFMQVQKDSVDIMEKIGQILGWFPKV
jgi:hypothetical protein